MKIKKWYSNLIENLNEITWSKIKLNLIKFIKFPLELVKAIHFKFNLFTIELSEKIKYGKFYKIKDDKIFRVNKKNRN